MTPKEYEKLVAEHFRGLGYTVHTTPYCNDYGVDVFAEKGNEKIAIQAKMYGLTTRSINRQMVMELHGAKDYFDCTKAVIATDGNLLANATEVASKLGIQILRLRASGGELKTAQASSGTVSPISTVSTSTPFDEIWRSYIMPLEGKTLYRDNGESNRIVKVDWSGVERVTSTGGQGRIGIEIFRRAINHIFAHGEITRDTINQEYAKRASSGIVLILAQVPLFEFRDRPSRLILRRR